MHSRPGTVLVRQSQSRVLSASLQVSRALAQPRAVGGYQQKQSPLAARPGASAGRPKRDTKAASSPQLYRGVPIDGAGSGGGPPSLAKRTGGDGDGESHSEDIDNALTQAGIKASDLPKDMQEALSSGRVSGQNIRAYAKYANIPILGLLCRVLPSFRDRVLGNPRFLLVLAIEVLVGGSAKLTAEAKFRKNRFNKEINMVASDMALEIIADVTVVWLLSTKVSFKKPSTGAFAKWSASLPAHAFQVGKFTPAQRIQNVLLRAAQFMAVGFGSGVAGHTLTTRMVEHQKKTTPKDEQSDVQLAPVIPNAAGWGSFMALSANSRYQLINGMEERVLDVFVQNPAVKALLTLVVRFSNTYAGGLQWMWYASRIGLQ